MQKLSQILPVFLALSFGVAISGCDAKDAKKDGDKKAEDKKAGEDKKVDDGKTDEKADEDKADGGW
jgi:hypothetical protein